MSIASSDLVVVVDEDDQELGTVNKAEAHRRPGVLHRAVSAWIIDPSGPVLLQRRAHAKYHFAGRWSNACCTHPRPGETPAAAIRRRVREELGLEVDLSPVGSFVYRAVDPASGLVEHELDHVFTGTALERPVPDRSEIMEVALVDSSRMHDLLRRPDAMQVFTPWLPAVMQLADTGS